VKSYFDGKAQEKQAIGGLSRTIWAKKRRQAPFHNPWILPRGSCRFPGRQSPEQPANRIKQYEDQRDGGHHGDGAEKLIRYHGGSLANQPAGDADATFKCWSGNGLPRRDSNPPTYGSKVARRHLDALRKTSLSHDNKAFRNPRFLMMRPKKAESGYRFQNCTQLLHRHSRVLHRTRASPSACALFSVPEIRSYACALGRVSMGSRLIHQ
jgi:hypothetical protein